MNYASMTLEQLCELFAYTPRGRPLNTKEVAAFFDVHPATPVQWRFRGDGPRYIQPSGSRRVLYPELELLRFAARGLKQSTSERSA